MATQEGESHVMSGDIMTGVVEPISDDQELFLKVLENLKNAVNTTTVESSGSEVQVVTSDTVPGSEVEIVTTGSCEESEDLIMTCESHPEPGFLAPTVQDTSRSEPEEPGTTTVTVSDKTKSLILQKLANANIYEKTGNFTQTSTSIAQTVIVNDIVNSSINASNPQTIIVNIPSNSSDVSNTILSSSSADNVVLSIMGINSVTGALTQKTMVSARPLTKESSPSKHSPVTVKPVPGKKEPSVHLFSCNYCDYYSDNKSYFKQHVDFVHNTDRPFKCPYCDYAGKRSHALREHLIVHTDNRPFQCQICKATFRKKGHLTNHIKLHNSKRLVKCPLCKALVYDTGDNGLDAHLKKDHDTDRLFGCDLCEHVAANEPDILRHLSQQHKSKLVTHKCEKCPFQTANAADFTAHTKCHDLADMSVQINSNTASSVIGVATVPKDNSATGLPNIPNTSVRLVSKNPSKTGMNELSEPVLSAQPAVVRPVWVKCTVCGFTEKDSEAIKKHMLEHLKDQYGENYVHPVKDGTPSAPRVASPDALEQQVINTAIRQEKLAAGGGKGPILVPVSNVDSLLAQHAGKIDMNSPILVPVTDPSVLKTLQTQTGIMATNPSVVGPEVGSTASKLFPVVGASVPSSKSRVIPSASVAITSASPAVAQSSPSKQTVLPIQPFQLETLLKNPNVKVIPLSSSATSTSASIVNLVSVTGARQGNTIVSHKTAELPRAKVPPVNSPLPALARIPVPLSLSVADTPKLPPEFATPSTDSSADPANQAEPNSPKDQSLSALQENLANVKKLIHYQEKINKQIGNPSAVEKGVVYYIDSTEKLDTSAGMSESFIHDPTVGRFKCTLCGYTCEYQRTIKAHIWKHSGHKQVDYPMFQNGPLSVYDDEPIQQSSKIERSQEVGYVPPSTGSMQMVQSVSLPETTLPGSLPGFIVYEKSSTISSVAPALANKIVAKQTLDSLKLAEQTSATVIVPPPPAVLPSTTLIQPSATSGDTPAPHPVIIPNKPTDVHVQGLVKTSVPHPGLQPGRNYIEFDSSLDESSLTIDESEAGSSVSVPVVQNVVVETMESVANCAGLTAMQSQQNSPRISTRSPDSGVWETAPTSVTSMISKDGTYTSQVPILDDGAVHPYNTRKRGLRSCSAAESIRQIAETVKKARQEESREDSAVTLLSLLKKGPNYNPACPTTKSSQPAELAYSNESSPAHEDSNSVGETDNSGGSNKPKLGISTSLLAVIEQLRERSKSDGDEEKPVAPPVKKQYKRRSRKSSIEDNTPASGIENVEEFVKAGEVKYRCKLCHYTNESTLLLRQHMKLHKPKQEFECSLCDLIAESSEALQDHMIQHCKVRTYQCKLCNSTFNYKSQLRAHMRMHNDQDILMCAFCDFETRNTAAFKVHLKNHATKPPFKCTACNEEFTSSQDLKTHKRDSCLGSAEKSASSSYSCDECDFTCVGRREMKNHQRIHMGKAVINVPKKCPYCDFSDLTIEQIRKHISDIHGESKPLKCNMCGFVAVSIRSLKSHMKRHVNDQRFVAQPLEQYKCNLCGYVCHHLPSLKSHMWRHAADLHYSYEFTNDVINAAIDFDSITEVTETTEAHVLDFKNFIYEKMKSKRLEHTRGTLEESAKACCWVTFRCCQCGFETINKAELNKHMGVHTDIIKMTLEVADDTDSGRQSQDEVELRST